MRNKNRNNREDRLTTGGYLFLRAYMSPGWSDAGSLVSFIQGLISEFGLIPLQGKEIRRAGVKGRIPLEMEELESYLRSKYEESRATYEKFHREGNPRAHVHLRVRQPEFSTAETFISTENEYPISIGATEYPEGLNQLALSFSARPRVNKEQAQGLIRERGESIMQLYRRIGLYLIPRLEPTYLWCAEDDEQVPLPTMEEVAQAEMSTVFWANYYLHGFLDPHLETRIRNSNVGEVTQLNDGIWWQLHEKFSLNPTRVERTCSKVLKELEGSIFSRVQWTFTEHEAWTQDDAMN